MRNMTGIKDIRLGKEESRGFNKRLFSKPDLEKSC